MAGVRLPPPPEPADARAALFKALNASSQLGASFQDTEIKEPKGGGVNNAGPLGGVGFITLANGKKVKALIKRDTKGTKVRAAKVLAEAIAGNILEAVYDKLDHDTSKLAKVDLVRGKETMGVAATPLDETGEETYLRSMYIAFYKGDLWWCAYLREFELILESQISNALGNDEKILELSKSLANEFKNCYDAMINRYERILKNATEDLEKANQRFNERMEHLESLNTDLDACARDPVILKEYRNIYNLELSIRLSNDKLTAARVQNEFYNDASFERTRTLIYENLKNENRRKGLITSLAKVKADAMERPSGVTNPEARRIVSKFIRSDPRYLKEIAKHWGRRLWLKDLGLHNGNIGVQEPGVNDGDSHLVSLDFGAAGCKLGKEVNPFFRFKVGLPLIKSFYKHHFLEYDNDLIASVDVAEAFIEVGRLTDAEITKITMDAIDSATQISGLEPLKKYCKRIGMKSADYERCTDRNELLKRMKDFSCKRYISRARSLKEDGYALLLEHCVNASGAVIQSELNKYLEKYPELYEYALKGFRNKPLVRDQNISQEKIVKRNIIEAVGTKAPMQFNLPYYYKMINYYSKRAECAYYSMRGEDELKEIKPFYEKLNTDMEALRKKENILTDKQKAKLKKCEDKLKLINEYITDINNNRGKLIRHFSDQSYFIHNENTEELKAQIREKVREFRGLDESPQSSMSAQGGILSTGQFAEGHSARVNLTSVEPINSNKSVNVVSVQWVHERVYRSDLYFSHDEVAKLGDEGCLIIAAKEVFNFRLGNPHPEKAMVIKGNLPENLVKAIIDYCEVRKAQGEKGCEYVNRTKFNYITPEKRMKQLEQRVQDKADAIFGEEAKELGISKQSLAELQQRTGLHLGHQDT